MNLFAWIASFGRGVAEAKAWQRRAPSQGRRTSADITGAKLLRNGLENVTVTGRQL